MTKMACDLGVGVVTVSWSEEIYKVTAICHGVDRVTVTCHPLLSCRPFHHSQISPSQVSIRHTQSTETSF